MDFPKYFPVWDKLTGPQQERLLNAKQSRTIPKGTVLNSGSGECAGLFVLKQGQIRAYILSEEGREITVYRLFDMDICLFSASCMFRSLQFDIMLETEKDTELWVIAPDEYKMLMEQSAPLSNHTSEIMATRFSEVVWLLEQILWKSMDKRIAAFLLEEAALEGSAELKITHEVISNHLGTHREVVTRMLRYFQSEGMVLLTRGSVKILDEEKLAALQ